MQATRIGWCWRKAALFACSLALGGCGGIAEGPGRNTMLLTVREGGAPLAGAPVVVTWQDQVKTATTDSRGAAEFAFDYWWGRVLWIVPPLGTVPRRAPVPAYTIQVAGQVTVVPGDSPATTYDHQGPGWRTKLALDLKRPVQAAGAGDASPPESHLRH